MLKEVPRIDLRPAPNLASEHTAVATAIRLSAAVTRTLTLVPTGSRCLMRSLVLLRLLSRRGIDASLVIGVKGEPFIAHAWVEHRGIALLDPGGSHFARLLQIDIPGGARSCLRRADTREAT